MRESHLEREIQLESLCRMRESPNSLRHIVYKSTKSSMLMEVT